MARGYRDEFVLVLSDAEVRDLYLYLSGQHTLGHLPSHLVPIIVELRK